MLLCPEYGYDIIEVRQVDYTFKVKKLLTLWMEDGRVPTIPLTWIQILSMLCKLACFEHTWVNTIFEGKPSIQITKLPKF